MINIDDIIKINRKEFKGLKFRVISIISQDEVVAVTTDKNNKIIKTKVKIEELDIIKKSKRINIDFG